MPWPHAFKSVVAAAIFVGLGVLTFLLARAWPILFPDLETLAVDRKCDLRAGPCARDLPAGGRLVFSIQPRTLPLMKTLRLRVDVSDITVAGVQVDIVGQSMNMGLNRTTLSDLGDGQWRGETLLPVCSAQIMRWQASVWLDRNGRVLAIPHHFSTRRGGLGTNPERQQSH